MTLTQAHRSEVASLTAGHKSEVQKLKSLNEGFVNEMMADHKRKLEQQDLANKRQNVKCVHAVF